MNPWIKTAIKNQIRAWSKRKRGILNVGLNDIAFEHIQKYIADAIEKLVEKSTDHFSSLIEVMLD